MLFDFQNEVRSIKGKLILVLALVVFIIGFLYYENNGLMISHYKINSNKSLKGFKGFKIIHLSDLHSKKFGNNNKNMIKILKKENTRHYCNYGGFDRSEKI
ncbi:hypothetical protein SAMN00017405_0696 [Desulfonispora thiosulfatigenes DSM 11270]|uniref:Calcineurin-like phosphoesterase n=1 Tax=Desulfonispora thiosulfatigenes DSM 11270 TaxID=656914 RepID=A0A1W1UCB5_DESTI|nr:hypothetical protein [Desulfonispora thiosulfatigenes]SMB78738.1 hypothetical protein SAMN00017405_0696 [Desulfonispora thiosulfatigenes DSM 11270]